MKWLILCVYVAICAQLAYSQSQPEVIFGNIAVRHEAKGWRVISVSSTPIHFNLNKGDLIVRIEGRNAAETGPMLMTSFLNQGDRNVVKLFIERGDLRMETKLLDISSMDYDPMNANPFKHTAGGFSAPDEEFKDIDGQTLTLEQFRNKWLLLDFMGTWCAPCMDELPEVLRAADRHAVNLLMVALNDKPAPVRRMRQTYKIGSPIAMMSFTAQLPMDFGIATNRWTGGVPGLVLIRPDGEIAMIAIGAMESNHLDAIIECMMSCSAGVASKQAGPM